MSKFLKAKDTNEIQIKTRYSKEMSIFAEVKKESFLHKLKILKRKISLVQDKDYIIVETKPFSKVIIFNTNPKYNYYVESRDSLLDLLDQIRIGSEK